MSSIFGHDYQGRKNLPLFFFLTRYFPKALVEVTKVCVAGNAQHNKELPLFDINWSRGKSTDQLNTALRHMMDHATSGPFDQEPPEVLAAIGADGASGTYHLAKAAWRILAELELTIEKQQEIKQEELNQLGPVPTASEVTEPYAVQMPAPERVTWYGKYGEHGHTYSGPGYSGPSCPKCGSKHNLEYAAYVEGYFEPEFLTPRFAGDPP